MLLWPTNHHLISLFFFGIKVFFQQKTVAFKRAFAWLPIIWCPSGSIVTSLPLPQPLLWLSDLTQNTVSEFFLSPTPKRRTHTFFQFQLLTVLMTFPDFLEELHAKRIEGCWTYNIQTMYVEGINHSPFSIPWTFTEIGKQFESFDHHPSYVDSQTSCRTISVLFTWAYLDPKLP